MVLADIKCVPCQGGEPILSGEELDDYMGQVDGWELYEGETKIKKEFEFDDFKKAIGFVNKVAELAEEEGHHPDIILHDYKIVRIELWTHKIGGLHKNDFILASKIDAVLKT